MTPHADSDDLPIQTRLIGELGMYFSAKKHVYAQ